MTQNRSILCMLAAGWIALAAQVAPAQQDPARAQVAAATANAISALKADIATTSITPDLTVRQYLDTLEQPKILDEIAERAQMIGGPRWIDDQTCQVQLEIPGSRVAYSLVSVAAVRPRQSPIPAAVLEQRLADWKRRSFTATGTAVSSQRIPGIRPPDLNPRWAAVPQADLTRAVLAAKEDAARQILDSIRPISTGPNQTVGDMLTRQQVRDTVTKWIVSRPVTQVGYDDNLQVNLTLAPAPGDLFRVVMDAAEQTPGTTIPSDAQTIELVLREFAARASAAVGRGRVGPVIMATTAAKTIDLPAEPPPWVSQSLDAEAEATGGISPLRTKTAAEAKATDNLRARINALPLTPGMTIGDAAQANPAFGDAVARTLLRARVFNVAYRANGTVAVRMMIDPRVLWSELRQAAGQ